MNYHTNEWIQAKLWEHWEDATEYLTSLFGKGAEDRMIAMFLCGSQNYGLDHEHSDVDTKLIVLPSFEDICFNKRPISFTYVRENDEHIDIKDIRLIFDILRKQNINFVEMVFTDYAIVNEVYYEYIHLLSNNKDEIAYYNPNRAVATMKGQAMEKLHAMEHRYPAKEYLIDEYGYDEKQVHHIVRIDWFIENYINGKAYEKCLHPEGEHLKLINELREYKYSLEEAREIANKYIAHITELADKFREEHEQTRSEWVDNILDYIQKNVMEIYIRKELDKNA